jgi:hypothetical protein
VNAPIDPVSVPFAGEATRCSLVGPKIGYDRAVLIQFMWINRLSRFASVEKRCKKTV